jgi:DNA-binding transcriptional LysR family regulator
LLSTFVAIVDLGSYHAAAARVGRSVPAISLQMKRLEALFAPQRLFEQRGRRRVLTPLGEILLSHARNILQLNDALWSCIVQSSGGRPIRFGAPDDYAVTLVPPVLERFPFGINGAPIEMVCAPSQSLVSMIEADELDVALVTKPSGWDSLEVVRREPIVWASHPRLDWSTAEAQPLAVFQPGCQARKAALDAFARTGRPYRVAFSSPSVTGLLSAVRSGLAVGAVARCSVPSDLAIVGEAEGFPSLPHLELSLAENPRRRLAHVDAFRQALRRSLLEGAPDPSPPATG